MMLDEKRRWKGVAHKLGKQSTGLVATIPTSTSVGRLERLESRKELKAIPERSSGSLDNATKTPEQVSKLLNLYENK
jgi:hypothetical protein